MLEARRAVIEQPNTTGPWDGASLGSAASTVGLGGSAPDILAEQDELSAALEDVREERFAAEQEHLDGIVELNRTAAADVAGAFRGGLSEVRRQFRTLDFDVRRILAAIVGDLAGSLFDSAIGSIGGGGLLGLLGDWFQGGFAAGGQVAANRPALVGEQGPELFVPGEAGTIVPNHALGQPVAVYQQFNVNEGATEGAVRMLTSVAGEIKRQTIAAVIDAQRRTAGALL